MAIWPPIAASCRTANSSATRAACPCFESNLQRVERGRWPQGVTPKPVVPRSSRGAPDEPAARRAEARRAGEAREAGPSGPSRRERARRAPGASATPASALELAPINSGRPPRRRRGGERSGDARPTPMPSAQNLFKAKAAPAAEPHARPPAVGGRGRVIVARDRAWARTSGIRIEALAPKASRRRLPAAGGRAQAHGFRHRAAARYPAFRRRRPARHPAGAPATAQAALRAAPSAPSPRRPQPRRDATDQLAMNLLKEAPAAALRLAQTNEPARSHRSRRGLRSAAQRRLSAARRGSRRRHAA